MCARLECHKLVCRRGGRVVLSELDWRQADAEAVALLGPSGCGKSTFLRCVAGLETPEDGEIRIAGQVVTQQGRCLVTPHRRGVSMLFQDLALWPNLSVKENVRLGLSGQRLTRKNQRERVAQMLELCEIADLADRRPGTLSGGQQQRVALARALAPQPQLLLLDEPFGGLDLLTKRTLLNRIRELQEQLGFGLVLVTHDPLEVQTLCSKVAVLEHGSVVDFGTPADLVQTPRSALSKAVGELLRQHQPSH